MINSIIPESEIQNRVMKVETPFWNPGFVNGLTQFCKLYSDSFVNIYTNVLTPKMETRELHTKILS